MNSNGVVQPATPRQRWLARALEPVLSLALFCAGIYLLRLPPFTRGWVFAAFVAQTVLLWALQKGLSGATLAERIAGMKAPNLLPGPFLEKARIGMLRRPGGTGASAIFLTLASIALAAFSFDRVVLRHPLWAPAAQWKLDPYLPQQLGGEDPRASETWSVAPFFYTMGAWPTRFRHQPVFYTLPYEKGPPEKFIGHIIARWEAPSTRVIFEGPKTPLVRNRELLRGCILSRSFTCLAVREEAIERHLSEMSAALHGPREWDLRWFKVENPALPRGEEAQGVMISASSESRSQDRFIFVTPAGTHQAVIFDYPRTPAGEGARDVFRQAVRTIRVSDDLAPGRSYVNKELQSTRLDAVMSGTAPAEGALQKLAEVQTLLLAKASVDPRTFETYFHIGGTSLMVARFGKKLGMLDGNIAATPTLQTLESAQRYATDVSGGASQVAPQLARLQDFVLEARKYF